jgi:hypothetical protein
MSLAEKTNLSHKNTGKMKLNKEWHQANRMPENPTMEQRIAWHIEHAKNCGCREMPESVKKAIKNKNILC